MRIDVSALARPPLSASIQRFEHEQGGTNPYKMAVDSYKATNHNNDPLWAKFKKAVQSRVPTVPHTRDTIQAERYQLMIVAFVADNPGIWALHCRNDFHAKSGMFKQIIEAPGTLRDTLVTWKKWAGTKYEFISPKSLPRDGMGANLPPFNKIALDEWQRNVLQCGS